MANYKAGDVNIDTLLVISQRGSLDLSASFYVASIYESIFTPGIVCDIVVLDTNDQLGSLKLSGDEQVIFNISIQGGTKANYIFHLYELGDVTSKGAQKSKMYTLKCASEETMFAKTNTIKLNMNKLCSEMVQEIHNLYSNKPINLEQTQGAQLFNITAQRPYEAIKFVKQFSVSAENKSSSYVYFESRQNNKQVFNFVTIESMFNGSVVKKFQQSDAINTNILISNDNNILAYSVPKQFNSMDKVLLGGPRQILSFNLTTHDFQSNVVTTTDTNYATGGSKTSDTSSGFISKYYSNISSPPQSFYFNDFSQKPATGLPENSPDYQAYLSILMQNSIKIRVPGDTVLTPGILINCVIPNKQGLSGPVNSDPLMSGNFVISRIHHRIGIKNVESPRYTCIVEGIKGKYDKGV